MHRLSKAQLEKRKRRRRRVKPTRQHWKLKLRKGVQNASA